MKKRPYFFLILIVAVTYYTKIHSTINILTILFYTHTAVNLKNPQTNEYPIHIACKLGDKVSIKLISRMIELNQASLAEKTILGELPIHIAIRNLSLIHI